MYEERDLYRSQNGLYPVVMNGKLGANMPGDVAGFTLEEALRLVNGKFERGDKRGQPYATPFRPKTEKPAAK